MALIIGGAAFIGALYYQVSKLMPSVEVIEKYQPSETTQVFASDGTVIANLAQERREHAEFKDIPQNLVNATIAKEDRRFWDHKGVDWKGTARALWVNVMQGEVKQGGSTLTQQLARNVFLSQQRTMSRKMQEVLLAQQIEKQINKEQVLELYLNQVYYGNQAYGVKAAARAYFNKSLGKLTLAECALLAALPQRPSGYEPFGNPDLAIQQRNLVLELMEREGYITATQSDAAKKEPLRLAKRRAFGQLRAPYFTTDVLRTLEDQYGRDLLLQGSLKIYTTLDMKLQQAAEAALQRGIQNYSRQGVNQGAIVLIDLKTGYVRALVGGRNFDESQYNAITQGRRQPGSSFKPIVYATAFELGKLTPTSTLSDTPVSYPGGSKGPWRPKNSDGRFRGSISVTRALASSVNIPAIRAMEMVSPRVVAQFAKDRFGIESPLDPVLPLALGASAVKPMEMAKAFSVFATGGHRVEPIMVRQVRDQNNGIILSQRGLYEPNVLSERAAGWMDDILRQAVVSGTGKAAARIPEARGKTGTTSDHRDAWFVGYTPRYIAVVWVASAHYSEQRKRWEYRPMRGVFGGTVCATIWADFMSQVLEIEKTREKNAPKEEEEIKPISNPSERPELSLPPEEETPKATEDPLPSQETEGTTPGEQAPFEVPKRSETPPVQGEPMPPPKRSEPGSLPSTPPTEPPDPGGSPRVSTPPPPAMTPEKVSVRVCADTGMRANDYCPETLERVFTKGREPQRRCSRHGAR